MTQEEQEHDSAQDQYTVSIRGPGINFERAVNEATVGAVVTTVLGVGAPTEAPAKSARGTKSKSKAKPKASKNGSAKRKGNAVAPKMVKDLSLRPPGKTSLLDFAAGKQPSNHYERQVVIVYWLVHEAGLSLVTINHVNSCYVGLDWRRPGDLANSLQKTASHKGWLDTADNENVILTAAGEDEVRYELAAKKDGES